MRGQRHPPLYVRARFQLAGRLARVMMPQLQVGLVECTPSKPSNACRPGDIWNDRAG